MHHTAGQTAIQGAGSDRPERPLESIASAVQRINTAVVYLQGFIARFHGEGPLQGSALGNAPPEPSVRPHGENISRLFDVVNRLEAQVSELENIG